MPNKEVYVKPEKFFTYKKIVIYHAYKDSEYHGRLTYSFTTDVNEDYQYEFDIRDFDGYEDGLFAQTAIKGEIDNKELELPDGITYPE